MYKLYQCVLEISKLKKTSRIRNERKFYIFFAGLRKKNLAITVVFMQGFNIDEFQIYYLTRTHLPELIMSSAFLYFISSVCPFATF